MDIYKKVTKYLHSKHPNQPNFHQTVLEIVKDIQEEYSTNPHYEKNNVIERLIEPDRLISFRVAWETDNHQIRINRGYRLQYHNLLGPYKGGLRFHPTVNENILKFLGFEQCFKNALTDMPLGGGKGGADFNPKNKSENEIMRFCQAYMQELRHYIGPDVDVPAGDIGVGEREISYLFGHYTKLTHHFNGVITGKNHSFGGSCGRTEATGYGCIYFLKEILKAHDLGDLENKKIIISGAGNVALHAAEKAIYNNAKILTLSDSRGFLFFENGLTQEHLNSIKEAKLTQRKSLEEWHESYKNISEYYSDKQPWGITADIALPCATQNEICLEEAKLLVKNGIKVIAEGANMPVAPDARQFIQENNVIFGPGKAANAGGVAVSSLERSQNAQHMSWPLTEVDKKLREIMKDIHNRIQNQVEKVDRIIPYKKGANIIAFKKLSEALIEYGIR